MKNKIVLIFLILVAQKSIAQISKDSVELKIVSFKDTIEEMKDATIVIDLNLINKSTVFPVIIPKAERELMAFAQEIDPIIYYEVIYINRCVDDTLYKKKLEIEPHGYIKSYEVLNPKESKKIICIPSYYFFKKVGMYKFRIGFRVSRLNKNYKDINTNWISIYVKKLASKNNF